MDGIIYCDYCGEIITNTKNYRSGNDIIKALNQKNIREGKFNKYKWYHKLLLLFIIFWYTPLLRLDFCDQPHKDLYA